MTLIRPAVLAAWMPFNLPMEGDEHSMYLDTEGYVTTGMGNLIDPIDLALSLPWRGADGSLASQDSIQAEWQAVKANKRLIAAGALEARKVTHLRITDQDIEALDDAVLDKDVDVLLHYFPDFSTLEADCQLGLLSMAWAMGPGYPGTYPRFSKAIRAGDYLTASLQCAMHDTPPPTRRNNANALAFRLAAIARDPTILRSPVPPA